MKKYGLIGEKLGHSFSPEIHNQLFEYDYQLYEVKKEALPEFIINTDLDGFNVTIPYKQEIMKYCTEISAQAKAIGSVNTVVRKSDGSLFGDNTDYFGFEYLIKKSGIKISGLKAIILGSGGASKTVEAVLKASGCSSVIVISRTGENNYNNLYLHYDAEIIVNTTPVGMYPNNGTSPLDLTPFNKCKLILDLIYNPAKTAFILQGESMGIPSFNGLPMLVAQAKKAGESFAASEIEDKIIDKITEKISNDTLNIALIGMPGCGKSTVGKLISEKIHREFIDLDEEIERIAEASIPDIFSGKIDENLIKKLNIPSKFKDIYKNKPTPEGLFRLLETYVLSMFSKESGKVISTGGGIVTTQENKKLLKQNSRIIYLERPLSQLSSEGRPLSQSKGVNELYNQRKPLYEEWCDYKVENLDVLDAVFEVLESIGILAEHITD